MGYLDHCRYRNCDGVLAAGLDFSDHFVLDLINSELPIVTIDYPFPRHMPYAPTTPMHGICAHCL
jgi:DNA-binding LacI/PurR family transcriptional regulator